MTCALLPRSIEGLHIGERHDPMGVPFNNGPVSGEDVFIPMDYVIGGQDYVGQGWRMLMECLSIGRSISLPSLSIGGTQLATRSMSAYASVREQFGIPIQKFEGIREPLARIFTASYWMSAARDITCGAIDSGEKPSVVSAIVKHYLTEELRTVIDDAMDIQGGAAICRGDRNILGRIYTSIPIAITVEGANILTRSLIVFGQGAMRCHPFLLSELAAIAANDRIAFDKALSGHVLHVLKNQGMAFFHALTGARFARVPAGRTAAENRHYQHLTRLSAAFAYAADMGLLTLGGSLKRSEYLSGRYADALAWLYIASMTLKRYHDEEDPKTWPLVEYTLTRAEHSIQQALDGIISNFPNRVFGFWMRLMMFPLGSHFRPPTDKQIDAVVTTVLDPQTGLREHLSPDIYLPTAELPGLGKLEAAYQLALAALAARSKIDKAARKGTISKDLPMIMAQSAREKSVINEEEYALVDAAETAMDDVIQVNFYDPDIYKKRK
jgi:acyl-CoA dehydrogenase